MYGIDVSHHQGAIDMQKVKDSGKDFVIIKLSEKSWKDPKFSLNYANAHSILKVGCYIYNKVLSVKEAEIEANFAVTALSGTKMPCGVWLDMEAPVMRKLSKQTLTDIINCEANILKKSGYNVGVYCNKDWYYNVLDGIGLSKYYPFWIARYPSTDNGTVKESLSPRSYADIWQYSSKGKVDGINGNVDLDLLYTDFVSMFAQKATHIVNARQMPTLRKGSRGDDVKNLQQKLVSFGYPITIDGIFGNNTYNAVVGLQGEYGLVKDGIVGVKTWTVLFSCG